MPGSTYKSILPKGIALLTTAATILFIVTITRFTAVTSFLFSWILNFSLMFWISSVENQLQPAHQSRYFDSFRFEKEGKIYEKLGVHWYRKLLVFIGWEKLNRKNNPVEKSAAALFQLERATRASEFGHLVIAVLVLLVTVVVSVQYSVLEASWLILLNLLFNVYPIMVQRYNRPRLRRAIKRFKLLAL